MSVNQFKTPEDLVEYLEKLVLIKFTEAEREKILKEVNKIIEFFRSLEEIEDLDRYEPLFHVHDVPGPTREDEIRSDDLLSYEEIAMNAELEGGYIRAPKTLKEG